MLVLLGIGFVAGVITAVSPCVLPVLPIVLAGGASGGQRRPYAIIAGLTTTFVVSILFAAYILDKIGLPADLLRNVSIVLLFVIAATLLVPQVGLVVERALAPLGRRRGTGDFGGGFLLGCALGFVFVPCGGPILAYVTAQSASLNFGFRPIALAIAYALGASAVMLAIAIGGQRVATPLRAHAIRLRSALGLVVAAAALALVFNLDTKLQTALPNWTQWLQGHTENTAYAREKLYTTASRTPVTTKGGTPDYGLAPDFHDIGDWLNSKPLTIRALRGKVVLVDFWTYSCINCLRTLPHLNAWYSAYRRDGFVIVGVHTPEFAFEHSLSNVRAAVRRLGVEYPVALDNDYGTWNAYANQYWPADYLVDKRGHVRHVHFGEGDYEQTETTIRKLLGVRGAMTHVRDTTPRELMTPESYLGYKRLTRYLGTPVHVDVPWRYQLSTALPLNDLTYGGTWTIHGERAVAGKDARLRLHFHASKVFLVLGGTGRVTVSLGGTDTQTVRVSEDKLYTLVDSPRELDALLELRFTPGVSAYAFTFG